jgi:hypothetical protein
MLVLAGLTAVAQQVVTMQLTALDGESTIGGTSPYQVDDCSVTVNGVSATVTGCKTDPHGKLTVNLQTALAVNQLVAVTLTQGGRPLVTGTTTVTAPLKIDWTAPKEGDKSVSGAVTGPQADCKKVNSAQIEVYSGTNHLTPVDATYDSKKFTFSATLSTALSEDQTIHIHLFDTDSNELSAQIPATVVQSLGYDWGRVKAYFTLGATYERQNGKFGSPDGYAGLNVDYNWFTSGQKLRAPRVGAGDSSTFVHAVMRPYAETIDIKNLKLASADAAKSGQQAAGAAVPASQGQTAGAGKPAKGTKAPVCGNIALDGGSGGETTDICKPQTRWMLNTYFEARMTQIPISNGSSSGATGSTSGTGSTVDVSQFQGAYLEGGVYLPIIPEFVEWTYHGQDNALFVAPLAKLGFQAISNPSSNTGSTTGQTSSVASNVSRFFGFGGRIGLFKMPADLKSTGPELVNYIDLTVGKWDNLVFNGAPHRRFDAAGRFKLPYTPLYIGGEVNVGDGPNDIRVFFGTRVDIGSIIGKLVPSAK